MVTNTPSLEDALKESLSDLYAIRDWHAWLIVEATALHWAHVGQLEAAAVLLGHLEQQDIRHGAFSDKRKHALDTLRSLPEAQSWLSRGASLDRDEAVAYALCQFGSAEAAAYPRDEVG